MEMISNIGSEVVCDFCNGDGRFSMGGLLVGSYAVCGECSAKDNRIKVLSSDGNEYVSIKDNYMPIFLEIINELDSVEISKSDKGYETIIKTDSNNYMLRYTDKALEEFSKDEISELWDLGKTFQQNVLEYRKKTSGTSDGISYFMSFDEYFKLNKESK